MKIYMQLVIFLFCLQSCIAQKVIQSLECGPISYANTEPLIKGFGPCSRCGISFNIIKNGFALILSDSTYQIAGFQIGYENDKKELIFKDIFGSKVTNQDVNFLDKLKPGDFLTIDCINVTKDSRVFKTNGMLLGIVM